MSDARAVTVAVDAMGGDHAPDAVLEGVTAALAADPALRVAARRARRGRRTRSRTGTSASTRRARDRDHRDGRAPGHRRAREEGLARSSSAAGSSRRASADGVLLGRATPARAWRPRRSSWGAPGRPAARDRHRHARRATGRVVLLDVGRQRGLQAREPRCSSRTWAPRTRTSSSASPSPRVGLLNIGEEPTKGSALVQEAHALHGDAVPGLRRQRRGRRHPRGHGRRRRDRRLHRQRRAQAHGGPGARRCSAQVKDAMTASAVNEGRGGGAQAVARRACKERLDPDAVRRRAAARRRRRVHHRSRRLGPARGRRRASRVAATRGARRARRTASPRPSRAAAR